MFFSNSLKLISKIIVYKIHWQKRSISDISPWPTTVPKTWRSTGLRLAGRKNGPTKIPCHMSWWALAFGAFSLAWVWRWCWDGTFGSMIFSSSSTAPRTPPHLRLRVVSLYLRFRCLCCWLASARGSWHFAGGCTRTPSFSVLDPSNFTVAFAVCTLSARLGSYSARLASASLVTMCYFGYCGFHASCLVSRWGWRSQFNVILQWLFTRPSENADPVAVYPAPGAVQEKFSW